MESNTIKSMRKLMILILAFLVYSCQNSIQDNIVNNIQKNEHKDSCVVKIVNITPFDWDKMYVFCKNSGLEEVNQQLGFEYPYFEDIAKRIIFTKSKKVVYHEEEYPDPDKKNKLEFTFGNDTTNVMVFTKKTAIFSAKKKEFCGWIYYELKPMRETPVRLPIKTER
jgi:hypothetical protein